MPVIAPKALRPLHRGVRTGAGRKPSCKMQVPLRLPPAMAKRLRSVAERSHVTLSKIAGQQLASLR